MAEETPTRHRRVRGACRAGAGSGDLRGAAPVCALRLRRGGGAATVQRCTRHL